MLEYSVQNLSKRFGSRGIFHDLTFISSTGSITAIAGPNGSGKSTLCKILMGLLPQSDGEIAVSRDNSVLSLQQRLDLTSVVTPYFNLYEPLTGDENFEFFAKVRGKSIDPKSREQWLERFGLGGRGADFVGAYSSGMRQRLKFAVALALEPELLFIDEPASNLDDSGKEIVFREVTALRDRALIFWATNETNELSFADRVVRLE